MFSRLGCLFLGLVLTILSSNAQADLLAEVPGWGIRNRGPSEAKGVIYFVRGYNLENYDGWHQIPYFLRTLNADGWDVVIDRIRPGYEPPKSLGWPQWRRAEIAQAARHVTMRVSSFRRAGYKRVVGAGHSFGAWVMLGASVGDPKLVDQLILSAPSAHGKVLTLRGTPNVLYQQLASESESQFSKLKTPTFVGLFKGDEFEPPRRADLVKKVVAGNKSIYMVDRPAAFTGHFSAYSPVFDFIYGECLARLLDSRDMASCAREELTSDDWRAVASFGQAAARLRAVSPDALIGKSFVRYGLGRPSSFVFLQSKTDVKVMFADDSETEKLRLTAAGNGEPLTACIAADCGRLVMWDEKVLLEFDSKADSLKYWWLLE